MIQNAKKTSNTRRFLDETKQKRIFMKKKKVMPNGKNINTEFTMLLKAFIRINKD